MGVLGLFCLLLVLADGIGASVHHSSNQDFKGSYAVYFRLQVGKKSLASYLALGDRC